MQSLTLKVAGRIERIRRALRGGWTPPPRISLPAWADKFRKLAKEAGSTSGQWETATVEVARGPMMAVTETGVRRMSLMVSTQMMKTALLENIIGYFAHLDPCPMLLVQPKAEAAEQFSKERITPMVRATPVLRKIMGSKGKTRSKDETLSYKAFPGGFLGLVGAGSPDNLARRPIRVVLFDEIDKYPITREGNPIKIAEERLATFGASSLSVRVCSPTVEEESLIEKCYAQSDQRRASVECPHCQHRQFLDFFKHVHWDRDGETHLPDTARLHCEGCGTIWSEGDRLNALQTCRWHQTRPFTCCDRHTSPLDFYDRTWRAINTQAALEAVWVWSESPRHAVYMAVCPVCEKQAVSNAHAGFQAGKMFSPWAADRPQDMANKFVDALGDEDSLQTFYNTQLGVPYRKNSGKEVRIQALLDRREVWAAELPDAIACLTIGVDVQDYRLEIEVVAWGRDEESWSVEYHIIEGEFSEPETQRELDAFLMRKWHRADGRPFVAKGTCIDSGGHHTEAVYKFCKARIKRRIWAIKGESAQGGQRNPVWPVKKPNNRNKSSYRPVILGVNSAKDTIMARLHKENEGAGYMHFPTSRDVGYFDQLTAERSVFKFKAGHKFRVWEVRPGRANEALDCRVYAYAALMGLLHHGYRLNAEAEALAKTIGPTVARPSVPDMIEPPAPDESDTTPLPAPPAPEPPKRRRKLA